MIANLPLKTKRRLTRQCLRIIGLAGVVLGSPVATAQTRPINAAPTSVIFDTDMWGDIDDALALAGLHALEDRGEAKILAVTSTTSDRWTASYIDVVDTYYGRPDVPIGLVRNGVRPPDSWSGDGKPMARDKPMYTEYVSNLRRRHGALVFPHAVIDGNRAADSVALLRRTLAAQPDGSVVVIGVGFGTNLARLMGSKPDSNSPLDGMTLIARKVRLLSMMAGRFADREYQGEKLVAARPEYNIRKDLPAARSVLERWPTPIVMSGSEIGFTMRIKGAEFARRLQGSLNPVAITYRYMDQTYQTAVVEAGGLHDHKTFDLTAVLYAIRPSDGYFGLSNPGRVELDANGVSTFVPTAQGRVRILTIDNEQRSRTLEAMTMLVTQPRRTAIRNTKAK